MKILMLTTNSSLLDGINRHILAISGELVKQGCEVVVCTVHPRGELHEAMETVGAMTYSLDCANGHDIRILSRFNKVMKEFAPDVIHSHVMALMEKIVLSLGYRRLHKVRTVHGTGFKTARNGLKHFFERMLNLIFYAGYDFDCYVSNGVMQAFRKNEGDGKSIVLYNPVDCEETSSSNKLRTELGIRQDEPIIGAACRIAEVKNPVALARVMRRVLDLVPNAHAVVIGDGDAGLLAGMKEVASGCDRFHFLGYRSDASDLIGECDCCVLTSSTEGMPTVLLEAMTHGVPVAFWRGQGGLIDLDKINSSDGPIGVVADQGDEDGLAEKIVGILNGNIKVSKDRILEVARRYFSRNSIVRKLIGIYESAKEKRVV